VLVFAAVTASPLWGQDVAFWVTLPHTALRNGAIAANAIPKRIAGATAPASGPAARPHTGIETTGAKERLHVVVGQSLSLQSATGLKRIFVGNPSILETYTSGPNEVIVTAKGAGISSLVLWDADGIETQYVVSADVDPEGLEKMLGTQFPQQHIAVEAVSDHLTLVGSVATPEISDAAAKLAGQYAKNVVNTLRIAPVHPKQVQLKLRIAELDRTRLEAFAVNFTKANGSNIFSTSTQQFATTVTSTPGTVANTVAITDPLNLFFFYGAQNIGVTVKDLESKNILQILAEPNLTTISGQPARFLSGGEFPFPIVQPGGTGSSPVVTIQFKPYGVKVDFTPVVNEDGTIQLKISPEVSSLDYNNAISISGFTVPAIATRRTETQVELKDGQSFAISGLLDRQVSDQLSQIPGIANVPILGQLFRSKNLNHSVSELVIVVTASVVDPLHTTSPTDNPKYPVPFLNEPKFDRGLTPSIKMEADPK
jgi:pilus assembly protein CpaC